MSHPHSPSPQPPAYAPFRFPDHQHSEAEDSSHQRTLHRTSAPDVSTQQIRLVQDLVDHHLFHYQTLSALSPRAPDIDSEKFLRQSNDSNLPSSYAHQLEPPSSSLHCPPPPLRHAQRPETRRKPLRYSGQQFLSPDYCLEKANRPPSSLRPLRNRSPQPTGRFYSADAISSQHNMAASTAEPSIDFVLPQSQSSHPLPQHPTQAPQSTSRSTSITTTTNNDTTAPFPQPPVSLSWKPGRTEWAIMLTLSLSSLVVALDSTILIASLPNLASQLHASTTSAFWAGSAYLLPYAVVQPFLACVSDIFGRRPLLVSSLVLFFAGSIPCALAQSMGTLLAGRVVQGIGGGGVVALTQAIYTDIIPLRLRPKYFSVVLLAWAVGTMVGPVVGGSFTDMSDEGWRWIFWINCPIAGVAIAASWVLVRLKPAGSKLTLVQKLMTVDYVGGLLMVGGLTSLLVAVSWGGNQYSWGDSRTVVPLVVGLLALAGFAAYERYVAKYPFVQKSVFPGLSSVVLFALAFSYGVTLFMALYYVCFYFSAAKLESATDAGVDVIAALAFTLPTSIICGVLMTKLGRFRWAIWGGHAIETIGYGLLVLLDENTPTAEWAAILAVVGIGTGMSLSSLNFAVQTSTISDRDSAAATVMYTFLRSTGMCVGVSIGSAIFQNVASGALADRGLDPDIAKNAEAFVLEKLVHYSPGEQGREDVLASFVAGLSAVFVAMTVIKGVSFALSLAVSTRSMDRDLDGRYKVSNSEKNAV